MAAAIPTSVLVYGTALWGLRFCVFFRVWLWLSGPTNQTAHVLSPLEVTWAPQGQHVLNTQNFSPGPPNYQP